MPIVRVVVVRIGVRSASAHCKERACWAVRRALSWIMARRSAVEEVAVAGGVLME